MFLFPSLITALSMLLFAVVTRMVGVARGRYKASVPATSGHADFERYFRVQQNTLEQLVLFLPSLWLFAAYVSADWASVICTRLLPRSQKTRAWVYHWHRRQQCFAIGWVARNSYGMGCPR